MTWYNKFRIHYLFNDVLVSLLSILILCIILYEHSYLHILHCMWLICIRSCTKDLSHEFLENRWLVHNQFIGLDNPLEVVVHHLLIEEMAGLGYWDEFPMVSALVCMVAHYTRPIVSYDLRLLSNHNSTKLFHCIIFQLREYWTCVEVSSDFDLQVRSWVDHIFHMDWVIVDGSR